MTEFPIMAYLGVHNNPNLEENYKQFKECGFNISLWRFSEHNDSDKSLVDATKKAYKNGIELIACSDKMYEQPADTAKRMKSLKGLYGYYMVDEPDMKQIAEFKERYVDPIRSVDTEHPIYANLFPYYDDGILERIGCKSYEEYMEAAEALQCDHISFDFYPVTVDGLRRDAWYRNLQLISDFAKKKGKDFWAFILSVPHYVYPQPELSHLRIQAYTNLAYGAQGLEYFTYQTPYDDSYDFHNGPIEKDSVTVTNTWHAVRQMNDELKKVLPVFHHATDFKVVRTHRILWWNQLCCKELPVGFKSIKVRGNGAIVSTFKNDTRRFVMIVNSSHEKNVQLKINTKFYVVQLDKNLEQKAIENVTTLLAGDMMLFEIL